jgi:SMI1-KNR4 cell-wall
MSEDFTFEEGTVAGAFTDSYVADTENMTGLDFTPDFLAFLKRYNGGTPKKRFFTLDKDLKVLEFFLCLEPDYSESDFGGTDIGVVWSQIEDRLNDYLVPFASVFAGDFLCFDYEDNDEPKIVLWNHDLSDEGEPVTEPVADSFEEFLSMLTDDDGEKS